jgi:hypothetical protein
MNEVITKAELARELDLSRARVSQLCKIGLPVRPDGRLNRAEALAWVKANVCSWRGGWWGDIRQKPNARRGRVQDELAETAEAAVIHFINEARQTGNIESFAHMALRFGCSVQQAFAVARWFDMFLAFYFVPRDPEREHIRVYDEPDWNRMAADAGTTADVEAWQGWMNRLNEDGEAGA